MQREDINRNMYSYVIVSTCRTAIFNIRSVQRQEVTFFTGLMIAIVRLHKKRCYIVMLSSV